MIPYIVVRFLTVTYNFSHGSFLCIYVCTLFCLNINKFRSHVLPWFYIIFLSISLFAFLLLTTSQNLMWSSPLYIDRFPTQVYVCVFNIDYSSHISTYIHLNVSIRLCSILSYAINSTSLELSFYL